MQKQNVLLDSINTKIDALSTQAQNGSLSTKAIHSTFDDCNTEIQTVKKLNNQIKDTKPQGLFLKQAAQANAPQSNTCQACLLY